MGWKNDIGWTDSVDEATRLVAERGPGAVDSCHIIVKSATAEAVAVAKAKLLEAGVVDGTLKIHEPANSQIIMTGWRLRELT